MSSSRPRVTYVIDDLGHGGAQRQLALTLGALDGAVESTVVVLSDIVHPYAERIRELGVPVEVIPRRAGLEARRVSALARTLGRFHTRIAHATLDGSDAYTYFAAHACRIPAVLSLRSDRLHVTGGRARVLRWMMRHASAITVNSQAGRTFLEKDLGVHPGRIHRVANIVDVPASPAPVRPQPGVIGVVGRLVDIKRFDVVIDALSAVRRSLPHTRLVVVGDGPERDALEARAHAAGVAEHVEFAGALDDATTRMLDFDCLAVASTYEGLPNVALEAMARGIPVVAVRAGDLPRIVQDGITGVLAADASAAALADAIARALTSPALQESARLEGPRFVRDEYSPGRVREQLLAVYAQLVPAPK